jgi:Ran GTPase-activating protein (RanGAP) involved in mRNA processing and transport
MINVNAGILGNFENVEEFIRAINANPEITSIDLISFKLDAAEATALGKGLVGTNITSIHITCKEGDAAVGALVSNFEGTNITSFALCIADELGADLLTDLGAGLAATVVTSVSLSAKQISADAFAALGAYLAATKVTSLSVNNTGIKVEGATALVASLEGTNITSFKLVGKEMGADLLKALGEGLAATEVTSVDLSSNEIGPDGADALGKALERGNVIFLNLDKNKIGHDGAAALGKHLPQTNISSLSLYANDIKAQGAVALVKGLLKGGGAKVTSLDLSCNEIGPDGAAGLGPILGGTNIASLSLSDNKIGDDGAVALAEGLSKGIVKLVSFDLSYNEIGPDGAAALGGALKLSPWILKVKGVENIPELQARLEGNIKVFKSKFLAQEAKASPEDAAVAIDVTLPECEGGAAAPHPDEAQTAIVSATPSFKDLVMLSTIPTEFSNPFITMDIPNEIFGESWHKVNKVYDPQYFSRSFFKIYGVCKALPFATKISYTDDSGQVKTAIRPELPVELWEMVWKSLEKGDFTLNSHLQGACGYMSRKIVELPDDEEVCVVEAGAAAPHPDEML